MAGDARTEKEIPLPPNRPEGLDRAEIELADRLPGSAPARLRADEGWRSPEKNVDIAKEVSIAATATLSGDGPKFSKALQDTFAKMNLDSDKFEQFGKAFAERLKPEGIEVRSDGSRLIMHKNGSPDAAEYILSGWTDQSSGLVRPHVEKDAYDWKTKQVNGKDVNEVIDAMRK